MSDTIDNKKIVLTNRIAVAMLLFIIGATFSATKFYDETKYQQLISDQNKERIEEVNKTTREYVEQEVGGLRSDWERDREAQEKRFEKLEEK